MHYVAIVNGQEREVEINEVAPDHFELFLDGQRMDVDAKHVAPTTFSFLVDNEAYNIEFEQCSPVGFNLLIRSHVVQVDVLDLRKARLRSAHAQAAGHEGPASITSPMPGKVVTVMVKEGDEVVKGQGLMVVEAMKMENELRAPRAGIVRNLKVEAGVIVDSGAMLCAVE
ncbi:MAG: biotin/lipoyl-containing protein [Myxococcota bacterium]